MSGALAVQVQVNYAPAIAFVLGSVLLGGASILGIGYWSTRLAARLGSDRWLLAATAGVVGCLGFYWLLFRIDSALALWVAILFGALVVVFSLLAGGVGLARRGLRYVRG